MFRLKQTIWAIQILAEITGGVKVLAFLNRKGRKFWHSVNKFLLCVMINRKFTQRHLLKVKIVANKIVELPRVSKLSPHSHPFFTVSSGDSAPNKEGGETSRVNLHVVFLPLESFLFSRCTRVPHLETESGVSLSEGGSANGLGR